MRPLFTTILVPALLLPLAARAQTAAPSDADRVTARMLAHQGHEAQTHGRYAEAADDFRRAEALVHAPTLELGLARADVGLGKLVEAHEIYRRIVREELLPGAPAPFAKALLSAKQELAALEPRLAWVTIEVQGPPPTTVSLILDDAPFPTAAIGTKRASDPGEHHVRVAAPGFVATESTFALREGQSATVSLVPTPEPVAVSAPAGGAVPPVPVAPPAISSPEPGASVVVELPSNPAQSTSTPLAKTAGVVVLGIGLAGLGAGGILGVLALNKHAALSGDCPGGHCPPGQSDQVAQYNALATASTISIIAGAAGVVGGFTLVLTAPKATSVTAYAGWLGAGITGRF